MAVGTSFLPLGGGSRLATSVARTLTDAKMYLVNQLTRQATITIGEETAQLRIISNGRFHPRVDTDWIVDITDLAETYDLAKTYDLEFWDEGHGLSVHVEVKVELPMEQIYGTPMGHILQGTVTEVTEQKVSIIGADYPTLGETAVC